MPRRDEIGLDLGPARIFLIPPEPPVWQERLAANPGPASLALTLLALARPRWQGVLRAGGRSAPCAPDAWADLPAALLEPLLTALCPPWLEPAASRELAALERHLAAKADYPALSCAACREQEERGEATPPCHACPLPPPPASARAALDLEPLLRELPGLAPQLLAPLLAGMPAPPRRLLWLQLLLCRRLGGGAESGGHCPLLGGRDTF